MVNHYSDVITRASTFDENQFVKLYTYALKYTQTDDNIPNDEIFHKIDTKEDFLKMSKLVYE